MGMRRVRTRTRNDTSELKEQMKSRVCEKEPEMRGAMCRCLAMAIDGDLARRFRSKVVHVIDHGDEQVEEELAAVLHFVLHRAAALECVASTNDQRQVVRAELRVVVRCVGVREASRRQDSGALDARL